MRLRVRWLDMASYVVREEVMEDVSLQAAVARMESGGAVVLAADYLPITHPSRLPGHKLDAAWWCRELRLLLAAGMTVVEAIDTMHAQSQGDARGAVHASLSAALRQGQSLSAALAGTGVFPGMLLAAIKASERSGALVEALDDYLRYDDMIESLRRKLVSAAIYPALVLALGLVILLILLTFVVPRFALIASDLRGPASGVTGLVMAASHLLVHHSRALAGTGAAIVLALWFAWRRGIAAAVLRRFADAFGPVRRRLDEFRLAKLYQALALMFRAGFALDEALERCSALGLGARLSAGVLAARDALVQGRRVSMALADAGLTDVVSQRLLTVGERSGDFDRVLQTIAQRHGQRFTTIVERTTRLAEPILLLIVALAVGGVVVVMYLPVFDIAGGLR